MSARRTTTHGALTVTPPGDAHGANLARRRAWWSLAFYPVSLVAAFVIGEGIYSWLGNGEGDQDIWVVLVAATPALVVFALPGVAAVLLGRRAMRLGRPDGRVPAVIGVAIAVGFGGLNVVSYLAQLIVG